MTCPEWNVGLSWWVVSGRHGDSELLKSFLYPRWPPWQPSWNTLNNISFRTGSQIELKFDGSHQIDMAILFFFMLNFINSYLITNYFHRIQALLGVNNLFLQKKKNQSISIHPCALPSFSLLAHLSTKCLWWAIVVSQCPSLVVRHVASTIALKAYSSYTPGPIDSILGRKHQGDL